MQALLLVDESSDKIRLIDVAKPSPSKGEVLVKVKAAALNRRDQWIRQGKYPGIKFDTILGSDGAGVVESVGEEVDSNLIGKEVVINPNINWGENPEVQSPDYHIVGMPTNGTFAEYVAVSANQVYEKPKHLSWTDAAALPLGGLTAYRATFHHGKVAEGKNVLISGVGGGVAQFAFLFALAAKANVYVTSGNDEKLETCLKLGAKGGFNYKTEDWQKDAFKTTRGFDVVIDSAGGDQVNDFIKMMKPSGRIVFYGATNGTPQNLDMFRMFWNQITLQGSTMGNDQEFEDMVKYVSKHQIKPIIDSVFDLRDGLEAFDKIKSGVFGKVVISCS